MSVSKVRLAALGLAAAGIVAAGSLTGVGEGLRSGLRLDGPSKALAQPSSGEAPMRVADQQKQTDTDGGSLRVEAPGTHVDVDKERGKVSVTAPYTDVQVDPDKGRVQVRAPYVNLDIRW